MDSAFLRFCAKLRNFSFLLYLVSSGKIKGISERGGKSQLHVFFKKIFCGLEITKYLTYDKGNSGNYRFKTELLVKNLKQMFVIEGASHGKENFC